MDLAKQPLGEHHGYHYFSVDAFALRSRSLADEEFSNVATHHDIAAVPKNEVWLDDRLKPEFRFLIAEAAERLKLLKSGTDAVHAYEGGLEVARSMREKASGRPHLGRDKHETKAAIPAEVYAGPEFNFKNYRVRFVDGRCVRDLFKTDFSQGGNHEEYPFVPKGELWVEKALDKREVPMVVEHEYHECELMKQGHGYETAHPAASKREWQMRTPSGPRKYAGTPDVDGLHRALSSAPDEKGGGTSDLRLWGMLSDALRDSGKDSAADLAMLIHKPTYMTGTGNSRPVFDPDRTSGWPSIEDGQTHLMVGGLPVRIMRYRPTVEGDGGQVIPHPHRPEYFEAEVLHHDHGSSRLAPLHNRAPMGWAVIPPEHVARLMDEADRIEGRPIPYWDDVEENRVGRENRPREPRMPDPERYARAPQDLFARILAHPGARRFGLTRELLGKMPPQAVQDMAKQLGIGLEERPAAVPPVVLPASGVSEGHSPTTPAPSPVRPKQLPVALPIAESAPPSAEPGPVGQWFGREWERFKSDLSPLTDAATRIGNLVRRRIGVPEKKRRDGQPDRYATLAGIPGEEALFPHERERIEAFGPKVEAHYKTLIERSMENRPGEMPQMREMHALGRAGESARGGYHLFQTIAQHLFGHDKDARVAFPVLNSVFSANTDVRQHTGAALVTTARWLQAGKPDDRMTISRILKSVRFIKRPNAQGNDVWAYPTVRMKEHYRKAAEFLEGLGHMSRDPAEIMRSITGEGLGKTPNFGIAFLHANGGPVDTHYLKAVSPYGLDKTDYGRDLIRGVIKQAGLGRKSQYESEEHYNSDLMAAIAEHGGVEALHFLKQFHKNLMDSPQHYLAYKALTGQMAHDFDWTLREAQESAWTGVLSVIALRDLGVPPDRVAQAMLHDANIRGWNPMEVIFQPGVIDELVAAGVNRRDLDRIRLRFAEAQSATAPKGAVFAGPSPALASVARRITPSYGKKTAADPIREAYETAYESLTGGGDRLTSLTGRRMARDGSPRRYGPADSAAIFEKLKENPHDDAPWLALADSFDEGGKQTASALMQQVAKRGDRAGGVTGKYDDRLRRLVLLSPDEQEGTFGPPTHWKEGTIHGVPFRINHYHTHSFIRMVSGLHGKPLMAAVPTPMANELEKEFDHVTRQHRFEMARDGQPIRYAPAGPIYHYHATSENKIPLIQKKGLIPSKFAQFPGFESGSLGKTYLADTPQTALYYGRILFKRRLTGLAGAYPPALLRMPFQKVAEPDPEDKGSYTIEHRVGPKKLEIFKEGRWLPLERYKSMPQKIEDFDEFEDDPEEVSQQYVRDHFPGLHYSRQDGPIRYRAVYQPHPALTPDHHALLNKTYARFKLHPSRKTLQNHAAALTEAINSLGTDGSPGTMRQQQHLNRQLHRSKAFLGSLALAMKLEREGEPVRMARPLPDWVPKEEEGRESETGFVPVKSSWIAGLKLTPDDRGVSMIVKRGGKTYPYPGFGLKEFRSWVKAVSPGGWWWRHIGYPMMGQPRQKNVSRPLPPDKRPKAKKVEFARGKRPGRVNYDESHLESWLDPSGVFHPTDHDLGHDEWAKEHGFIGEDDAMAQGWHRVLPTMGDELITHNSYMPPNQRQRASLIDLATQTRKDSIDYHSPRGVRTIWSASERLSRPGRPCLYAGHVGHPDLHAFVRAIGENPQDMAPKLIFADWLDEHEMPHTADMFRNPKESPNPPSEYNPGLGIFQNGASIGAFRADPFYSFQLPSHWMNVHGHGRFRERGSEPGQENPVPGIRFHLHADDPQDPRVAARLLDHFETDPAKAMAIIREIGHFSPMNTSFIAENPRSLLGRMHRETPEEMVRDVFGVDPHQLQRLKRPGNARRYAGPTTDLQALLAAISAEKITPQSAGLRGRMDQAPPGILADYLEDQGLPAHARLIRGHLEQHKQHATRGGSGANREQVLDYIHDPGARGDMIRFMLLHPGRFLAAMRGPTPGTQVRLVTAPPPPRTRAGTVKKSGYTPHLIQFSMDHPTSDEAVRHYKELLSEGAIGQPGLEAQNWPERGISPDERRAMFRRRGQPVRMAQQMAQSFAQALRTLASPNVQAFGDAVKSAYDEAGVQGETIPIIHDTPENSRPTILGLLRGKPTPPQTLYAAAWHGIMSKSPAMEAFVAGDGPDSLLSIAMPGSAGYAREVLNHIGVSPRLIRPDENFNEVLVMDHSGQLKGRIEQLGLPVRELTGKSVRLNGMEDYRAIAREFENKGAADASPGRTQRPVERAGSGARPDARSNEQAAAAPTAAA